MHLFLNKKLRKGVGMKKIHAVIITGIVILMCIQVKAFSSEVYFTPDEIKEKILSEIELAANLLILPRETSLQSI